MVNINDKVSLIIDVNYVFDLNDSEVNKMIDGDTYLINALYKESLEIVRNNLDHEFTHTMTHRHKILIDWMNEYQCNPKNPMDIIIFFRFAANAFE